MRKVKEERRIFITDFDKKRLYDLIEDPQFSNGRNSKHIAELKNELEKAMIVESQEVPADVITMNSKFILEDLDSGEKMTLTLSFPCEAYACVDVDNTFSFPDDLASSFCFLSYDSSRLHTPCILI